MLELEMKRGFQSMVGRTGLFHCTNRLYGLELVSDSPQIVAQKALYLDADVLVNPLDILCRELGNTHGSSMFLALCEDGHDCSWRQGFICRGEPTAL